MAQYVTIKEFCKLAKISPQSVYKRLKRADNPLNNYVETVDNIKMISVDALKLYKKPETETVKEEPQKESATENSVNKELIEILKKELESKDEQIANLTKLLDQQQQLNMKTMQELDVVREEKRLLLESKEDTAEVEEVVVQEQPAKKPWWKIF